MLKSIVIIINAILVLICALDAVRYARKKQYDKANYQLLWAVLLSISIIM